MSASRNRIVFIGNPTPEEYVGETRAMNVNTADNIAQKTMIRGLHKYYGDSLEVISVAPSKNLSEIDLGEGVRARAISSWAGNRILYYLSITINYTKKLKEILAEDPTKETVVITAGPYIYLAMAVIVAKRRYPVKWVPFLVGAVEVPEEKFPLSLVSKLSRWTVGKADGAITYVARSVTDYMPNKPFVEIVYQIDSEVMRLYRDYKPRLPKKFTIAYTGALTSIYNIDDVIKVIEKTGDTYRWVFAGGGQYASDIEELANDRRYDVEYLGPIANTEAIKLQKSSHLLLCLKGGDRTDANQYYSKYAASGKLTEYLCSGTPILAGDIPAFSDDHKPFMTCEVDQSPGKIIKRIQEIKEDYKRKKRLAESGQEYAFENFTSDFQNKKIHDFLENF